MKITRASVDIWHYFFPIQRKSYNSVKTGKGRIICPLNLATCRVVLFTAADESEFHSLTVDTKNESSFLPVIHSVKCSLTTMCEDLWIWINAAINLPA